MLYLVFMAATMALARRIGGRAAALVTGLYLALGPTFLTVFSLNCVGQYVDVLALGGVALALLARVLDEDGTGRPRRAAAYLAIGVLLGAAFWQQPVALAYAGGRGGGPGAARARPGATRGRCWCPLGGVLGALPVLLWNVQNGWACRRHPGPRAAGAAARRRTRCPAWSAGRSSISFPILAGPQPGPSLGGRAGACGAGGGAGSCRCSSRRTWPCAARLRGVGCGARRPAAAVLPPLLMAFCLALFWAVASGQRLLAAALPAAA